MRTTACKSNGPGPGRREGEQPSVSPACWDHRARGWRPRHQKRVAHHLPVPTYTGPYAIVAAERSELAASQGERSELWLVGCIQLLDGSANQLVRQPKCGSVAKAIAEPARPIDLLRPALVAGAVVSVREQ